MHHTTGRNRTIASALGLVAAILMLVSLALSWYDVTVSASGNGITASETISLKLGSSYTATCPTSSVCTGTQTYQYTSGPGGSQLNKTGNLYQTGLVLVIVGGLLGLGGGVLGILSRGKQKMVMPAMALLALALLLAIATPMMFLAAQPAAFNSDNHMSGVPGSTSNSSAGPGGSYFGSCSGSGCGFSTNSQVSESATWG
ncbi:MAG: hypothetical protein L3K09_01370, partial [Thermoplasmata archaeon]|nr:hypothetical protein [Thermoplasmata archaeon]